SHSTAGLNRDLRSFPTRRSSDLADETARDEEGRGNSHPFQQRNRKQDVVDESIIEGDGKAGRRGLSILQRTGNSIQGETGEVPRSEEHTSELQSRVDLVCRLLLE